MFRRKKDLQTVAPYSRLASIYDFVMRHVDYVHWASYVESLFARHDFAPSSLMDLACGTGSLVLELRNRGYRVSGADGCAEMLEVGREKVMRLGHDIPLYCRNLLDLSSLPACEGVLCLYDSMNYIMSLDGLAQAFEQVKHVVAPGGLFVFDVCTESNSVRYFRDITDRDEGDGFSYTRHSYYNEGVQFNKFEIRFETPQEVVWEVHQQRIYPLSEIESVLEDAPFQIEGVYGGFGYERPTELSDRVHFVLRG